MFYDPLDGPVELPTVVRDLVGGRVFELVWVNQLGGLTLLVRDESSTHFLKWMPLASHIDLRVEVEKLRWALPFTPVPKVLDYGTAGDGTWLLMEAIGAQNAASPKWQRDPRTATAALGRGLRAMHDALPVAECSFTWSAEERLANIRRCVESGGLTSIAPSDWNGEFSSLSVDRAVVALSTIPSEDLVVCHGDACVPNTLIDDDGNWAAHVDLGSLGVADRWADLAVASWSTVWNYGPGWETNVYSSYGIEPDEEKIRYYRLLWELG